MLRASFEQSPFAQLVLQDDGTIRHFNLQAPLFFRIAPDAFRHTKLQDHLPALSLDELTALFHRAQTEGLCHISLTPNHTSTAHHAILYPLHQGATHTFALSLLPQTMVQSATRAPLPQESVDNSRAYKTFVRKLTHDFNNMLSIISTYVQLLDEEASGTLKEDIQEIAQAASRAKDMVQHLSTVSRSDMDTRRIVNLHDLLGAFIKPYFGNPQQSFDLQCAFGATTPFLYAHAMQLQQLLAHVLQNAQESFLPESQNRTLQLITFDHEAHPYDPTPWPGLTPGKYVGLQFRDSGCGMDPETLFCAPNPLFTTKSRERHLGLGLTTSSEIARQHGGLLHLKSGLDQGTAVTLLLPRALDPPVHLARHAELPPSSPYTGQGELVLIVEPYKPVADMMERILRQHQWIPLIASSPAEAIELARSTRQPIDLLITGLSHPLMSPSELVAQLSTLPRPAPLGLLILLEHDITPNRGSQEVALSKPFTPPELIFSVWRALNQPT